MKNFLVIAGSFLVASVVADRFILKADEDDPTGFIMVEPGFGKDDLVKPILGAVIATVAQMALKRAG